MLGSDCTHQDTWTFCACHLLHMPYRFVLLCDFGSLCTWFILLLLFYLLHTTDSSTILPLACNIHIPTGSYPFYLQFCPAACTVPPPWTVLPPSLPSHRPFFSVLLACHAIYLLPTHHFIRLPASSRIPHIGLYILPTLTTPRLLPLHARTRAFTNTLLQRTHTHCHTHLRFSFVLFARTCALYFLHAAVRLRCIRLRDFAAVLLVRLTHAHRVPAFLRCLH